MTDTFTFPEIFTPGLFGFATEVAFMADFTATMRESGLRNYPRTYAEVVAKQNRPKAEPKDFVPTVVFPREGGDDIVINGQIKSASAPKNGNNGGYEGPADLNYGEHEKKFGKLPGTRSGRGYVHAMSEAQKRFALKLLATKDTTNMVMVKGWTLDPAAIDTISKQHARPFIDALISCPDKHTPNSDKKELRGSEKQINWITGSLLTKKGILTESDITSLYQRCNYEARNVISELLAMKDVAPIKATKQEEITEGMYTVGERIFKVYMNRADTCMLVKELIEESFEYMGSAQWKLPKGAVKMTLDEAKAYGRLTGTCCQCGTKLTDENSIAAGIGPICEGKF